MLPSTAHPERNRSKLSRSIVCFKMPSIGSLSSLGESNAVFLRGVGGDAATEPHKTGFSGYPDEKFFRENCSTIHFLVSGCRCWLPEIASFRPMFSIRGALCCFTYLPMCRTMHAPPLYAAGLSFSAYLLRRTSIFAPLPMKTLMKVSTCLATEGS